MVLVLLILIWVLLQVNLGRLALLIGRQHVVYDLREDSLLLYGADHNEQPFYTRLSK